MGKFHFQRFNHNKAFDLNCEYVGYSTYTEILKAVEDGEVDGHLSCFCCF